MIDERIEKRNQRFLKPSGNVLSERDNYSLKLRKDKIFDYFLNKRLKCNNHEDIKEDDDYSNTYEVNIEALSLSDEFKDEYKKSVSDYKFAKNYLFNEVSDLNVLKFVIFTLRNASSQEGFKESIEQENSLFDQIINYFFNNNDIEIQYELSWLLINITYTSNQFHSKLLKKDILEKFYEKTFDKRLLIHILWIINNLTANDKSIIKMISNILPDLKQRLMFLIKSVNSNEVQKLLMDILCTYIEKVKNKKNLIKYSDLLERIFSKFINDEELSERSLFILTFLTRCEDINRLIMLEKDYFSRFIGFFQNFNEDLKIFVLIMRCIGNISLTNNKCFSEIIIGEILLISENILSSWLKKPYKCNNLTAILRETLWSLANLLNNNEKVASIFIEDTNIYRLLIEVTGLAKESNIISEITLCFINLYKSSNYRVRTLILKGNFLNILVNSLKIENHEIINQILDTLIVFCCYAENISQLNFAFKIKFQQNGLIEKLHSFNNHNNCHIADKSDRLLKILENENFIYEGNY